MSEKILGLRWNVEQRFEFIEFKIFWEGRVNRSDIMNFFGISIPQASKDLSAYQKLAPQNLHYDRSEKCYFASNSFTPCFLKPNAENYLAQSSAANSIGIHATQKWITSIACIDTLPVLQRHVDVEILRKMLFCVRTGKSIEIFYQSMGKNRPEPTWRRITPHAFGSDGFRWHVRAFCHLTNKFKDFVLSRCLELGELSDPAIQRDNDLEWSESIEIILIPNPKLGERQRKAIAQDYNMENNQLIISIRRALLFYFKRQLRLDLLDKVDNPYEIPLVIANKDNL